MSISFTSSRTAPNNINLPIWANDQVLDKVKTWTRLRDTYAGDEQMELKSGEYLLKPEGMTDEQHAFYCKNATFYNMVKITVKSLTGTIFNKVPVLSGLSPDLQKIVPNITKDNLTLNSFSQEACRELIHMGRFGVIVDMADGGEPYLAGYNAETILDWEVGQKDGRNFLLSVHLLEVDKSDRNLVTVRRLVMVEGQYQQHIYKSDNGTIPDITKEDHTVVTPTKKGKPLDFIPFMFLGPEKNTTSINDSPMIDIVDMNIAHYRSYANLEHGLFFTACPIYYVTTNDNSTSEAQYFIGPANVWEIPTGERAGLIEFNGNGLKFAQEAIDTKAAQIASLGGRLIGIQGQAVSESDNQTIMKERNEQALLLNTVMNLDDGFTRLLKWLSWWQGASENQVNKIDVQFNKDFLLKPAAAREFRAIHSMYKDGVLPIEVVFSYLQRADVIPDWMTQEELVRLLEKENSFPNQPDFEARKEGYPDKKTQLDKEEKEADRIAQEKAAKEAAKNQPVPIVGEGDE